jgi:hypothetical protein
MHVVNEKWPEKLSSTFTLTFETGCLAQEASETEMTRAIRSDRFIRGFFAACLVVAARESS